MTSQESAKRLSFADLSPRRQEVARLVLMNLPRAEIARRLGTSANPRSVRTVDAHIRAIAELLGYDELPAYRRVRRWMRAEFAVEPDALDGPNERRAM